MTVMQSMPLPAIEKLSNATLYWAAACNLVCGVLLLLRLPRAQQPPSP